MEKCKGRKKKKKKNTYHVRHCCVLCNMVCFVRAPLKTVMQSKITEHHALNKRFPWKDCLIFLAMYMQ